MGNKSCGMMFGSGGYLAFKVPLSFSSGSGACNRWAVVYK